MTTATYMLLLWGDPAECTDIDGAMAAHGRFTEQCEAQGHEILAGEELAEPHRARLLRVEGDGPQVTDGPYAETTEVLGGFYLIRTADPDGLLRLAAPIVAPGPIGGGTIELRPLMVREAPVGAP